MLEFSPTVWVGHKLWLSVVSCRLSFGSWWSSVVDTKTAFVKWLKCCLRRLTRIYYHNFRPASWFEASYKKYFCGEHVMVLSNKMELETKIHSNVFAFLQSGCVLKEIWAYWQVPTEDFSRQAFQRVHTLG